MKPLFLTLSCDRDRHNGWQAGVSDTWLNEWGHLIDHRFVIGQQCENIAPGELRVPTGDDYFDMVPKNQQGWKWALEQGYEHVFQSCNDTYIVVPTMLRSRYESRDYCGGRVFNDGGLAYYSGGTGYWLSKRAIEVLVAAPTWGTHEDWWVGIHLDKAGIKAFDTNSGYVGYSYEGVGFHEEPKWDGTLSVHLSRGTGKYEPNWIHTCHKSYLEYSR